MQVRKSAPMPDVPTIAPTRANRPDCPKCRRSDMVGCDPVFENGQHYRDLWNFACRRCGWDGPAFRLAQ